MNSWGEFATTHPTLADFGRRLFEEIGLAYLATTRKDGAPRVHPVCPKIVEDHLFIGVRASSPKRQDLLRDGRYVLHALPGSESAEFFIRGRAKLIDNPEMRKNVATDDDLGVLVVEDDALFELEVEEACSTVYEVVEQLGQTQLKPIHDRWKATPLSRVAYR